jgi:Peptidase inhibitor family I36
MHLPYRRVFLPLALLGLVVALAAGPGLTRAAQIQREVAAYLAAHPGGHQITTTDISYGNGAFIVSVDRTTPLVAAAAPDCPSGWFCFYDNINFGYPRGKLSDCGFQDLGTWGWRNRTESVHYNMSTGSVTFINETGATDTPLFSVSTSKRTIADVSPYRNQADYVYRYC